MDKRTSYRKEKMMGSKTETFQKVSADRQKSLQGAVKVLDKNKKEAIAAALENPGFCGIIVMILFVGLLVAPSAGVLVLLA